NAAGRAGSGRCAGGRTGRGSWRSPTRRRRPRRHGTGRAGTVRTPTMTWTFRTRALTVGGVLAVAALSVALDAQQLRTARQMPFPQKPDWAKLEVETLHVQGQMHMIAGAGGNIAVQVGDEGVVLVDTGYEQMSGKVLAAIRTLSDKPLRRIINT